MDSHDNHTMPALFKFEPILKTVLWGGEKIAALKGVQPNGKRHVGESWEVSGLQGKESIVAGGPDKGLNLRELIDKYRDRLVGKRVYDTHGNEFPLLVKFIDAKQDLSVQVHPGDDLARRRHGCNGKNEFWYIIQADKGASLLAGLHTPLRRDDYNRLVELGTITTAMRRHDTAPGDAFFLPAGCLHSIGAGNLLCEVQQSSDITYRVHDYNRRDANGEPRQLHTTLAADAIDFNLTGDLRCPNTPLSDPHETLLSEPCFTVDVYHLDNDTPTPLHMPHDAFLIVTCLHGNATLVTPQGNTRLNKGQTTLVAASVTSLQAHGHATLLTATT